MSSPQPQQGARVAPRRTLTARTAFSRRPASQGRSPWPRSRVTVPRPQHPGRSWDRSPDCLPLTTHCAPRSRKQHGSQNGARPREGGRFQLFTASVCVTPRLLGRTRCVVSWPRAGPHAAFRKLLFCATGKPPRPPLPPSPSPPQACVGRLPAPRLVLVLRPDSSRKRVLTLSLLPEALRGRRVEAGRKQAWCVTAGLACPFPGSRPSPKQIL